VHLECPTPPAYLPTEDVEGKRALYRKQHLQVEEQDRKFGSHHHQRLRVTYRTASMGGSSVCPVSRRCRVSSAGSRWEIQFAPSTKRACDVQPSQCYGDHTSGCFATVQVQSGATRWDFRFASPTRLTGGVQHDQHEEVTKHLQHPRILEQQQSVQSRGEMNMNCLVEGAPRVAHTACLPAD
jgi:hypothetical protein